MENTIRIKKEDYAQQLGFRCERSTNNETPVEQNRLHIRSYYGVIEKF